MVFIEGNNRHIINKVAEFHDKSFENSYTEEEFRSSKKYVRFILLLCGIIFLAMGAFDYFGSTAHDALSALLSLRLSVFVVSVFLFFFIDKLKNPRRYQLAVSTFELLAYFVYIIICLIVDARNISDHTLVVSILFVSIFFLPGRWILTEVVAGIMMLIFMVLSAALTENLNTFLFARTIIYLLISYFLISVSSFRINNVARLQFFRQSELEKQSIVDSLTGVFNRSRFDNALDEWTGLFHRYRTPFCMIMFDLDNYKRVNDMYGHIVGDEVLRKCANEVRRNIRAGDIFARWGGEEFVILMPYNNLQTAYEQAERLRKRIEQIDLGVAGRITACFGVTEIKTGDTAESIIQRVDKLMYIGKRSGKNIVVKGMDVPIHDKK